MNALGQMSHRLSAGYGMEFAVRQQVYFL